MSLRVDFEPRPGYLYVAVAGEYVLADCQSSYRGVLQAAARERATRILLDCTRITGTATVEERLQFGMFMADEHARISAQLPDSPRVAILAVPPLMDPGRFTQMVANNRGVQMRASESLQELLSWLGV